MEAGKIRDFLRLSHLKGLAWPLVAGFFLLVGLEWFVLRRWPLSTPRIFQQVPASWFFQLGVLLGGAAVYLYFRARSLRHLVILFATLLGAGLLYAKGSQWATPNWEAVALVTIIIFRREMMQLLRRASQISFSKATVEFKAPDIKSFSDMMDSLHDILSETDTDQPFRFMALTPALGYLARPLSEWERLRDELLRLNNVRMICLAKDDVKLWHRLFEGRVTERGYLTRRDTDKASEAGEDLVDNLNRIRYLTYSNSEFNGFLKSHPDLAKELRKDAAKIDDLRFVKRHPELGEWMTNYPSDAKYVQDELIKHRNIKRLSWGRLPGYYIFSNGKRAIVAAPLFLPLPLDTDQEHAVSHIPQMLGFETNDPLLVMMINRVFDAYHLYVDESPPFYYPWQEAKLEELKPVIRYKVEELIDNLASQAAQRRLPPDAIRFRIEGCLDPWLEKNDTKKLEGPNRTASDAALPHPGPRS